MHARTCTWIMINCTFSGTSRNSLDAELSVCFSVLFCFDFFFLFNELNRFLIVVTGVTQPANYQHYCPLNFLTCTNWLRLKKGEINCAGRDLRRSGTKCEIWAFWHTSDLSMLGWRNASPALTPTPHPARPQHFSPWNDLRVECEGTVSYLGVSPFSPHLDKGRDKSDSDTSLGIRKRLTSVWTQISGSTVLNRYRERETQPSR